jgi:hypothetical protein
MQSTIGTWSYCSLDLGIKNTVDYVRDTINTVS